MSDLEKQIFRDAYRYLDAHPAPPSSNDHEAVVTWWEKAAEDLSVYANRWNNHPLMTGLLMVLYDYLEKKGKEAKVNALSQP